MGRKNQRGLELSFKPVSGGRGRGRWFKKLNGSARYFGWGNGVSDRASYQLALAEYRKWAMNQNARARRSQLSVATRYLQQTLSPLDHDPGRVNLDEARRRIQQLELLGGEQIAKDFADAADEEEKRRLIAELSGMELEELRAAAQTSGPASGKPQTLNDVLDEFIAAQRQRMERRQKLDELRAAGKEVKEASKENMSPGRFSRLATAVKAFREAAGKMAWDGTEATAARIVGKFRAASNERLLAGELAPASFNENMQCARQFCGWCESTYRLDRLPRDKKLFAKYAIAASAKAIPLDTLKRLWSGADDRGRCFMLLALNCAFYAADISNLRAEMIQGKYLIHTRGKTNVNVRYLLWPRTMQYLKKFLPKSGPVFTTSKGTPLVRHEISAKSNLPVCIDNVRLWFVRLCQTLKIKTGKGGISFSNLRDTAASEMEKIDRTLTDLFLAHADRRVAAFYIDGKMADSTPLDKAISVLETRMNIWSRKRESKG